MPSIRTWLNRMIRDDLLVELSGPPHCFGQKYTPSTVHRCLRCTPLLDESFYREAPLCKRQSTFYDSVYVPIYVHLGSLILSTLSSIYQDCGLEYRGYRHYANFTHIMFWWTFHCEFDHNPTCFLCGPDYPTIIHSITYWLELT